MKPVKFEGMNTNYVAPNCDDLPTMVQQEENGAVSITSVWKPDEEDMEILSNGGSVCLAVYGHQPPVAMWVQEVNTVE